jgi:hypothetical protein
MVLAVAAILAAYIGLYAVLRLTRYFVRQEYLCISCSPAMMKRIQKDHPTPRGVLTVESERNQIGCGKIQKQGKRFAESALLPLFRPLGEGEMVVRGFSVATISVFDNVDEPAASEGTYTRTTLVTNYTVRRKDQSF